MKCSILAPTKIARSVEDRKRKSDDRDAGRIFEVLRGHVMAGNALPEIWIPDDRRRDDREIVGTRLDVTNKGTSVKAQIRMLLKRTGVEQPAGVGSGWTVEFRRWLEELALERGVGRSERAHHARGACASEEGLVPGGMVAGEVGWRGGVGVPADRSPQSEAQENRGGRVYATVGGADVARGLGGAETGRMLPHRNRTEQRRRRGGMLGVSLEPCNRQGG